MPEQLDRLLTTLVNSKVQSSNNALFQTIRGLIIAAQDFNTFITVNSSSGVTNFNRILTYGTSAERLAFIPSAPPGVLVIFYETDTQLLYTYSDSWNAIVGGITQLTGDVTAGPGTGSVAATIPNDTVTYAKMQNVSAASRVLGRGDSGSGDVQELSVNTGIRITGTTIYASGNPTVSFIIGDGAGVISTGFKGWEQVNVTGTIVKATVLSIDSGSLAGNLVANIVRSDYAGFTTGSVSITGTTPPSLVSTNKSTDTTLVGWTTAFTTGDVFGVNVTSATTVTKAIVQLFTI